MTSFAALMVIVACHANASSCIREPVAVVSFHDTKICRAALPSEIAKAKRLAPVIYGDCVPVDPQLLAGKPDIRKVIDPQRLAEALSSRTRGSSATAYVATDEHPGLSLFSK